MGKPLTFDETWEDGIPPNPPTPNELLAQIGRIFAQEYPNNRKQAWRNVMVAMMSNVEVLSMADRDRVECVRAIITMSREIDEKMGADEKNASGTGEPLDTVAEKWTAEN